MRAATHSTLRCLCFLTLLSIQAVAAPLGDEWVLRNQLPTGEDLRTSATNDLGTCVVIGNHGTILTSNTGTNWITQTSGTKADLQDVIWSGSRFVAVGYNGTIVWSVDGTSWNTTPILDSAFTSVIWTGSQFVAVGGTLTTKGWVGVAFTSPDGFAWTKRPITGAPYFFGVSFNGTTLVAMGDGAVFSSTNGITWTKRVLPPPSGSTTAFVSGVVWTGSEFVIAGQAVWTSTTGTTWTLRPDLSFLTNLSLRWTGTEIIAFHTQGIYYTSATGAFWTDRSANLVSAPLGAGKVGNTYLTISYGGRIDGQTSLGTWTASHSTGLANSVSDFAHNGSLFVAIGPNCSWTSTDGTAWTQHIQSNFDARRISWDGSRFVTAGNGVWKSTDGITWTNTFPVDTTGKAAFFTCTTLLGKTFICGFDQATTNVISAYSTDGTTWNPANMMVPCLDFTTDGSRIIGVGWFGGVITSTDGSSWSPLTVTLANGEDFSSITYSSGLFVAVTTYGNIFTSANASNWQFREAAPDGLLRIVRTSNEFFAVGQHGTVLRSFEAMHWRVVPSFTSNMLGPVFWTGSKLLIGGASGNIYSSEGPPAVRPEISIVAASPSMAETDGTATITVSLPSAWTRDVEVPLAFSGAASSNLDYTVPASKLVIPAGSLSASLTITAKADNFDEIDESLIVTALTPTGDVTLGSVVSATVTVTDDDTRPTFGTPMADQLVAVGEPVVFSAPATGTGLISYQWKKNNVAITGAKASSYSIAKAALANAGEYFVEAKNLSETVPSNKPKLGVVTVSSTKVTQKINTIGTFTASAAGAVSYKWFKGTDELVNGGRITGATSPKLVITSLVTTDTAIYTCEVSLGALKRIACTIDFGVIDAVPVVTAPANITTRVSTSIDVTPTATNRPYKWVVSNLPPGLTYNATTGRITGKPTSVITKTVSLIAYNLYGTNPVPYTSFTITVEALPPIALGSFVTLLSRESVNGDLGARLDVTTTSTGRYTGRLYNGAVSYPIDSYLNGERLTNPTGHVHIVRTTPPLPIDLDFSIDLNTGALSATVTDGSTTATGTSLPRALATTNRTGAYNVALSPAPGSSSTSPEGHGYAQFTIAATGSFSVVGKLADATAFTIGTQQSADGSIPLFLALYTNKGSMHGTIKVNEDAASTYANNFIDGAVTWSKTGPNTGRSYVAGFPTLTLTADGGRYTAPKAPGIVMNLTPGAGNAKARFTGGGDLATASRNPNYDFTVASLATVTRPVVIPAGTTLAFNTAAGTMSGLFYLSDTDTTVTPNKALPRTVAYYGILIRPAGQPAMKALGFFNLPQMPVLLPVKTTSLTSPMLSGAVSITP